MLPAIHAGHLILGSVGQCVLGRIRRRLVAYAQARHRGDLAGVFVDRATTASADRVAGAIETLRNLPVPAPMIADPVDLWLPARIAGALHAHGIRTLADLTVRIPRRRRWWSVIAGLGAAGARRIEAFFAAHPALTERARALIVAAPSGSIVPWEQLRVPHEVDGSRGQFRAPADACLLKASNDYEAVQSWLSLHESAATQRAYRKEAERLIVWAIVERDCALSSLTTDDAIAYRSFLRRPTPRERWIGPSRPRHSVEWRPFIGTLGGVRAERPVGAVSLAGRRDEHGDHWLHVLGKGGKLGKVALPSLARTALDQSLVQRGLPVTPARWNPATPLVASLEGNGAHIESTRLWRVLRRFFVLVADAIQDERPATAERLRRASPHWMRHTHASHALARGAELIMVRDNLRHASISTTSTYLHSDEVQRARQFDQAFEARRPRV